MLKESVTIDDVVELLNDAYKKDPEAIDFLCKVRIPCNDDLAVHPTIQVYSFGGKYKVGIIGILNGIFGMADDGFGAIASIFDVVCPNGHDVPDKATLRDKCSVCNKNFELGKLTGFRRIR